MFVLVQFDPAYARISQLTSQEPMSWFFILTTGVVLVSFVVSFGGSYVSNPDRRIRIWLTKVWDSWSSFDRVVLIVTLGVILFMIMVYFIFLQESGKAQILGARKLGVCLLAYLSVLGIYRLPYLDVKDKDHDVSLKKVSRFIVASKFVLIAFVLMILLGGYKFVSAYFDQKQGMHLVEKGEFEDAVVLLEEALKKKGYHSEELGVALGHAYWGLGQLNTTPDNLV